MISFGLSITIRISSRQSAWCSLETLLIFTDTIDLAIHSRPRPSACLLASTTRADARSSRGSLNRPGSRTTMMPAYRLGGYRSGSEKSLSSVTRQRPSVVQIPARSASGVESRFWPATVATSNPAAFRNTAPIAPRFSSSSPLPPYRSEAPFPDRPRISWST
jgi:hypothetical protein